MLHTALLWLAAAGLLQAGSHGAAGFSQPGGSQSLAALHATTLGFMLTMLLAMVSRVTTTQQGRAVAVDRPLRGLFGLLQATTLLRLGAALWPPASAWLLPASAACLALIALAWAVHPGRLLAQETRPGRSLNRFKEKTRPDP